MTQDKKSRSMVKLSISAARGGNCTLARKYIKRALLLKNVGAAAGDRAFATYRLLKRRCAW